MIAWRCAVCVRNAVFLPHDGLKIDRLSVANLLFEIRRALIRRRTSPEMAIFSPFPGLRSSRIADDASPFMFAKLSSTATVVEVDFVTVVFAFDRSEFAEPQRACNH